MQSANRPAAGDWPTTQITLIHRMKDSRDGDSWSRFVRAYRPLILQYCRRRGLQESDAMDVLQDVLLQLSKVIGQFQYDGERGRFRNWLGTVTHRAMLKHLAKTKRATVGSETDLCATRLEECPTNVDAEWTEMFNAHVFETAAARVQSTFTADTWLAFHETFIEDRSAQHVATRMGRPVAWVYLAKSKVMKRMRKEILRVAGDSVLFSVHGTSL